ncbi:MAG: DUF4147 domain-containing protein [Gammaproteobacteria bacterium]|nr:DUF4147 domain-containing protein [Gammaproteobacteria bacterium]
MNTPNHQQVRSDLLKIFQTAIKAVHGRRVVTEALQHGEALPECGLVAIGKAAQAMTEGALDVLGDRIVSGLVISKRGHLDLDVLGKHGLQGVEAGHPTPDEGSLEAGKALLAYLESLPQEQPLLFLISGGASSLVELLPEGVDLAQLQRANEWLLASGLDIVRINQVRKAISRIKGGGLLNFTGNHQLRVLAISDVPKDDPKVIGSGLLTPDPDTASVVEKLDLPIWLVAMLDLKKPVVENSPAIEIVASRMIAMEAAAEEAGSLGYRVQLNRALISGEVENVGRRMAFEFADSEPGVTIWGGEPTVCLPRSPGRGGRNQHLALSVAQVIEGSDDLYFLSGGSDGTDGPGDDAGALVDGATLGRARRDGFDPVESLARADSGSLLDAACDLINTGPTGTNVMDLMIGLRIGKQAVSEDYGF